MKIHVLCRDGSPLGVTEKTLRGEDGRLGVGGAELALLTMCRAWQMYGNDVILYNDPKESGVSNFEQRPIASFNPHEDRDILIIFRSPNPSVHHANGLKVWWSCDSYTIDDFRAFAPQVDKIVTISPFHAKYFKDMYGIQNSIPIDLPVRTWEYKDVDISTKKPKQCIFTSIPDRGLMELHAAWPRIQSQVPDANLIITSDWRLWADWCTIEQTRDYRLAYSRHPNITYLGAVKRDELIRIQMESALHIYPCTFLEQFCISVAESQVAGTFPVTSDSGALATTNMGRVLHGSPSDPNWQDAFVTNVVELLNDPKLPDKQNWVREVAKKRFSIENILSQWDQKVFK